QSGWMLARSSAWISEASALANGIASRTQAADHEQAAREGEVLEEVRHLIRRVSRIVFPEAVRDKRGRHYIGHEPPGGPARAPAEREHYAADQLDEDRQTRS